MKISCHSCGSKYTIADDKVRGRRVKVRCKSCGTPIVVDGAAPQPAEEEPTKAASTADPFAFAGQPALGPPVLDPWSVNLSDTDQRTMTTEEIVAGWSSGLVTEDAFAWKEGMEDWIPVHEVPELKPLLGNRSQPSAVGAPTSSTSARLSGGRTQGAADLFGAVDSAGSEEDVATSAPLAPAALPGATAYDARPTGQRNENSVLFSLDALKVGFSAPAAASPSVARKAPPPRRPATQSAPDDPFGMSAGNSGVARLGGGGGAMFGMGDQHALLFAPAAPEPPPPPPPSADPIAVQYAMVPPPARGLTPKKKLIAGGAAALVVLLLIVIVVASSGKKPDEQVAKNESTSSESTKSEEKPREDQGSKKEDEAPKGAAEKKSEGETKPAETAEKKPLTEEEKKRFAEARKKEEEKKVEETAKAEALKKAAEVPPGAIGAPAFNKGAAISALSSSASAASGCKRPGGPTGGGKAVVTFAPSGRVTSANITGGSFGGTPVGGCVASVFRRAKVPAFSGNAVTVSKSFNISP